MIINAHELSKIALTPKNECWICDKLFESAIKINTDKFEIPNELLNEDKGIREHLKQLIGR